LRRVAARVIATAACCVGLLSMIPDGATAQSPPSLPVTAAALYAPSTGQLLYGVDADRRLPIASTTKLMTALITLQHVHNLSVTYAQNDWVPAAVDSQIGLVPGERMSVHDLLLALMLPSADDAAEDLAYNVGGGSVARFVGMMNAEARRLGLRHTHYTTPIGLDTAGNYSSASDLVKLASYDLTHSPYFARIVDLRSAVLRSGDHARYVTNRNDLVGAYPWIDGVKTGHTAGAGYVLVASGHRQGMSLISAVMGTDSEQERDASTLALLDYGFGAFGPRTPVRANEVMARPTVRDRPGVRVPVIAARTLSRVFARSARLRVRVDAPRQLTGPLPAQAVVGTAIVLDGRRTIARIPLLLPRRLAPVSGLAIATRFVTRPLMLLVIVAGVGAGGLFVRSTRRRRRLERPGGKLEAA
jgi:D-alanyl-D-alanine carboxypeptidase (penicillin-binding protein 5/6)